MSSSIDLIKALKGIHSGQGTLRQTNSLPPSLSLEPLLSLWSSSKLSDGYIQELRCRCSAPHQTQSLAQRPP
ncbi:unnamed protein product [Gadus morhua 'NCC']